MTDKLGQRLSCALGAIIILLVSVHEVKGFQNTAFTYQGVLREGGLTVSDLCDFQFTLMDSSLGGSVLAGPVTVLAVDVANGLFAADIDFGPGVIDASTQWLEIEVRHPTGGGAYETLAPRQRLAPAPSALFAQSSTGSLWQLNGLNMYYNDGNVGLGTSTPNEKLHVNGNVRVDGWIGTDADAQVWIASNGTRVMSFEVSGSSTTARALPRRRISWAVRQQITSCPEPWGGTIAGGGFYDGTLATTPNFLADNFCTIGGGMNNQAGDPAGTFNEHGYATVAGGSRKRGHRQILSDRGRPVQHRQRLGYGRRPAGREIRRPPRGAFVGAGAINQATAYGSAIVAGQGNVASGSFSFIGAGAINLASGVNSTVVAGRDNIVDGSSAAILGGRDHMANGHQSTILGGRYNTTLGMRSLAAGYRAKANHDGTFVWADGTEADFISTDTDQFLVRAAGGVGINTNQPLADLHVKTWSLGLDGTEVLNDDITSRRRRRPRPGVASVDPAPCGLLAPRRAANRFGGHPKQAACQLPLRARAAGGRSRVFERRRGLPIESPVSVWNGGTEASAISVDLAGNFVSWRGSTR